LKFYIFLRLKKYLKNASIRTAFDRRFSTGYCDMRVVFTRTVLRIHFKDADISIKCCQITNNITILKAISYMASDEEKFEAMSKHLLKFNLIGF